MLLLRCSHVRPTRLLLLLLRLLRASVLSLSLCLGLLLLRASVMSLSLGLLLLWLLVLHLTAPARLRRLWIVLRLRLHRLRLIPLQWSSTVQIDGFIIVVVVKMLLLRPIVVRIGLRHWLIYRQTTRKRAGGRSNAFCSDRLLGHVGGSLRGCLLLVVRRLIVAILIHRSALGIVLLVLHLRAGRLVRRDLRVGWHRVLPPHGLLRLTHLLLRLLLMRITSGLLISVRGRLLVPWLLLWLLVRILARLTTTTSLGDNDVGRGVGVNRGEGDSKSIMVSFAAATSST